MEDESTRSINRQISRYGYSAASQERNRTHQATRVWLVQVSESCGRYYSFFDALHFLFFFALMARVSSVGFTSKIPVLNVSFNRQEVIALVKRSDNIAEVSIQRGSSPFDTPTSSSQSSLVSQMSCFRAHKSIAKRLLSTCLGLGDIKCAKCPIAAEAVSFHVNDGCSSSQSTFNSIGQCVSFCHQCTATNPCDSRRPPAQRMSIFSAFNALPSARAVMQACKDLNF